MDPSIRTAVVGGLTCQACGRLPHARRGRLALVKLAAVFPVELALHALVLQQHPPYLLAVAVLSVSTTLLIIWVVEPSAMRMLRRWLHAPQLAAHTRLSTASALWRMRVTVEDRPGALEQVAHALAELRANVLDLQVHPLEDAVRDELIVAAPEDVTESELLDAVTAAGCSDASAWPTTALALIDGPTRALSLAARIAEQPSELAGSVAELLGARLQTDRLAAAGNPVRHGAGETLLRLATPWHGLLAFERPDEPFTPAESARAHRLAELAEIVEIRRVRGRTAD
jgi:predicted amino acid-binding ACT domain protein